MPICGISTTMCHRDEEQAPLSPPSKLVKLEQIKEELLGLEERKLQNSQLVRLLEEEIRKLQIKLSVKPSYNSYLLSRAKETSYWLSSNPELYQSLRETPIHDDTMVGLEEGSVENDDAHSNWSDISDRYQGRSVSMKIETTHHHSSPNTVSSDVLHHLLFSAKEEDSEASSTISVNSFDKRHRKFVQVTHSRNVTGFFGDYSLYHCTLHTSYGKIISNEKRYSDFVSLREALVKTFRFPPNSLLDFPEKKVIGKLKEDFIRQRQQGLEDFMNSVYLRYSQDINNFTEQWLCKG